MSMNRLDFGAKPLDQERVIAKRTTRSTGKKSTAQLNVGRRQKAKGEEKRPPASHLERGGSESSYLSRG